MDSIINGLDEFPEIDKMVRDELNLKFQKFGIKYLQNKLEELDPVYYLRVDLNNHRRLIRALEVCISSKKPYSSFIGKKTNKNTFNILNFAIEMNRDELYDKINNRVDHMISQGLVEEVKSLINFKNTNALNTVGYKELFLYFEKKCSLAESISEIKKNTRRYAKRQMTWLNSKKNIKKINHTISAQEVKRTYLDFR
jgi:tRNA dimethylallyltransferase